MNDSDWAAAENIARFIYEQRVDVNEVAKLMPFLRRRRAVAGPGAGQDLDRFLDRITQPNAKALVRSNQTIDYFRQIRQARQQYLRGVNDPQRLQSIVGWAVRLAKSYRHAPPMKVTNAEAAPTDGNGVVPGPSRGTVTAPPSGERSTPPATAPGNVASSPSPPPAVSPKPPKKEKPKKAFGGGEELVVKIDRIEGTIGFAVVEEKQANLRIDLNAFALPAIGGKVVVKIQNEQDDYWRARFIKKK